MFLPVMAEMIITSVQLITIESFVYTLQGENFQWKSNFAISLMANSAYYYIFLESLNDIDHDHRP